MVKLVEYSESSSSEEEIRRCDACNKDDSSRSRSHVAVSKGAIPFHFGNLFSYYMEPRDSKKPQEKQDSTPFTTSFTPSGSIPSSVATKDSNEEDSIVKINDVKFRNLDATIHNFTIENDNTMKNTEESHTASWTGVQADWTRPALKRRNIQVVHPMEAPVNELNEKQAREQQDKAEIARDKNKMDTMEEWALFHEKIDHSWTGSSLFTLGIAGTNKLRPQRRRYQQNWRRHVTPGATEKQHQMMTDEDVTEVCARPAEDRTTDIPTTKSVQVDGQIHDETRLWLFQTPKNKVSTCSVATDDTSGLFRNIAFGTTKVERPSDEDTHMWSPSPKCTVATSFVPIAGGFTLGQRNKGLSKAHRSDNSGNDAKEAAVTFSANVPKDATNNADGAYMHNPNTHNKPASQYPAKGEFLFEKSYKNCKPYAVFRPKSKVSSDSSTSVFTPIVTSQTKMSEVLWGAKAPSGNTSAGHFGTNSKPTAASNLLSTGVAGPKMKHQNSHRRKKKKSLSCSTFASISESASSTFQSLASSSPFGSLQSATTRQPDTELVGGNAYESSVPLGNMTPAVPIEPSFITNTSGSFVFGSSHAKSVPAAFQNTEASSFPADKFDSCANSAASATSISGVPGQVSTDKGTSCHSFKFRDAKTNWPTIGANFHFLADNVSSSGGFQIGCQDAQKKLRVRPKRSGMFAHKNSPRKDAKVSVTTPEPFTSFGFSSTPSPFGKPRSRTRKNVRLRKNGCKSRVNPFATHTFQCHRPSSPSNRQLHPHAATPPATTGFASTIGSTSMSSINNVDVETHLQQNQSSDSGVFSFRPQGRNMSSASQCQDWNHESMFQPNESRKPTKTQQNSNSEMSPTNAGSRRILRAALRSVEVSGNRASSTSPTTGSRPNDAEMNSEDERDWLKLKRLAAAAYYSKKYEDAAEYYRQSIELLESLFCHDAITCTTEMKTDKAKLHANRAAALMMQLQMTEAKLECRRSIEADVTYMRAYLRLGRIQVLLGDATNAKINMDTSRRLMEEPGKQASSRDQSDYAALAEMEANIKKLLMLQGEIKWYVDSGDYKQALVQTNAALVVAPNSRKLQLEKARILLHQKKLDQVIEFCTSIIEKHQGSQGKTSSPASTGGVETKPLKDDTVKQIAIVGIELGLLWATTLHYQDNAENAGRILDALEVVAPCSSHVIQLKRQWQDMKQLRYDGNERFKQGHHQEAIRLYSEAVQIDPLHQEYCAIMYCNRAAAHMGLKHYHTAILDCNQALQRKQNLPRALLRRARCHAALKMHYEAVKDYDQYLQSSVVPDDVASGVREERNESKTAIATSQEEAKQREAAKKRAEYQRRQQHSHQRENTSRADSRFRDNFERNASSNKGRSHDSSKFKSSGASSGASPETPESPNRTYYEVLGIDKTATVSQIRQSYRKLALVYHPDKAKSLGHGDLFKEMTAAYNVLCDDIARAKYNRELRSKK